MKSIVTGSHAYGLPTSESDVDLVVHVSDSDLRRLLEAGGKQDHAEDPNYLAAGGMSLRFGDLNLICCTSEELFAIWRSCTIELRKQAPVSRAFACRYMQRKREEAGFGGAGR